MTGPSLRHLLGRRGRAIAAGFGALVLTIGALALATALLPVPADDGRLALRSCEAPAPGCSHHR